MPALPEWISATALMARARALYRGVMHGDQLDADMHEEFRHHLEQRADALVREGFSPSEARLRARREFGHQETHRARAHEAMGLASITTLRLSWLDVKLGVRMLRKHPVLNLAAVFALAIGIPVGVAPSHLARSLEGPLPGDTGHRVRALRHWDPLSSGVAPTWDGDFAHWAQHLRSFSVLGAFRASRYNVAAAAGPAAPADGAQVTPAVFQLLRARPFIGRVLEAGDVAPDAPDVVVIGHALWSARFGGDPGVLGRTIRIGRTLHTVVGVMPEGFAFPNHESLWLPLRLASTGGTRDRTRVQVIGRLADGVTPQQAQAELSSLGGSSADAASASDARERARLRAEVVPFGLLFLNLPAGGLRDVPEFLLVRTLMVVLLLVACGNVAMLVFARTATRLREIAIRTSLGASRSRIVSQLFVETLLLAVIAAGVGLLSFDWALGHVNLAALAGETALPYWLTLGLTWRTALSALVLAVASATVAGVVPAVAITGRAIAQHLGLGARVRFGRLTSALVVADIAVSVAAVGMAVAVSRHATDLSVANRATGIPAAEYLGVELRLPDDASRPSVARPAAGAPDPRRAQLAATQLATTQLATTQLATTQLAAAQRTLVEALEREPGVIRVAVGDVLPRMEHPSRPFEVDGVEHIPDAPLRWTRLARVDVEYMGALGTPILSGRDFVRGDVEPGAHVAIVNTAFATRALAGRDPIGQRVRFPVLGDSSRGEWYEIVGVVGPLGVNVLNADRGEAVYLPAAPGTINPMQLAVHTNRPPATLSDRVRELVVAADPELVMERATALSDARQGDWYLVMGLVVGLVALVGVLLALATSGLYAMLSLAVSERTREIGIRAALGASRGRLLLTILRRSLAQVAIGAAVGLPLAARFVFEVTATPSGSGSLTQATGLALAIATGIVSLVGISACLLPTRRILAVQAREAMHADS